MIPSSKIRITIALTFFILSNQLFAQDTLYFDKHFQKVVSDKTDQYRVYGLGVENSSIIDFREDQTCLKATISGIDDVQSTNEFVWYIRNRLPEFDKKEYFKNLRAEFTFFTDQGVISKSIFNGNNLLYYFITDSSKRQVLTDGSGQYSCHSGISNEIEHLIFKDSLLIDHFVIRQSEQDTIYNTYDKMAQPPGGLQSFYNQILKTLKYPFLKQLAGHESKIYIRFLVDKNGQLQEFEALTPKSTRFEKKTINKLSKLPNWSPAENRGFAVKTRFILPVTFQLE